LYIFVLCTFTIICLDTYFSYNYLSDYELNKYNCISNKVFIKLYKKSKKKLFRFNCFKLRCLTTNLTLFEERRN